MPFFLGGGGYNAWNILNLISVGVGDQADVETSSKSKLDQHI